MDNLDFKFLLSGQDTLEISYTLDTLESDLDFSNLISHRDNARASRLPFVPLVLGGSEFLLMPYGAKEGKYPLILTNPNYTIACGPRNNPPFYVKFTCEALWRDGARSLHSSFLSWAEGLRLTPLAPEKISRVDPCFDYYVSDPKIFHEDLFISRSTKSFPVKEGRRYQTIAFGTGSGRFRQYDKATEIVQSSNKVWFYQLWGGVRAGVWRSEWQLMREHLKRFGIVTIEDFFERQGDALSYFAGEHDSLRTRTTDSNPSRWPLHPMWADLVGRTQSLPKIGIYRDFDRQASKEFRLAKMGRSLHGYLKRVAAIEAARCGVDAPTYPWAKAQLDRLLDAAHDPSIWAADVATRLAQERMSP